MSHKADNAFIEMRLEKRNLDTSSPEYESLLKEVTLPSDAKVSSYDGTLEDFENEAVGKAVDALIARKPNIRFHLVSSLVILCLLFIVYRRWKRK
ncbi:hypothetical protein FACS189419_01380 [Planctomycetales bacterium]|nr:hypothetical protein FACS189419_01380 [Planctomycetales bacterium]